MKNKNWCSFSPDSWFGKDISVACKKHDYAYWDLYGVKATKGNKQARKDADILLRERIIELSNYPPIAWLYYIFVRMFGWINLYK